MDRINYKRCIQACFACAAACMICATESLKQPNFRIFALGVSLNRECALLCTATAQLLAMGGKNGVQVFIDGKPSPLSGADLATFLQNLQSSQVEAIELITNPSAKYEAAGNAGIINIKLKKNRSFGTNG